MRGWYKPVTAIIEPEWDDDPLPVIERLADNVRSGRDLVAPVNWDEQIKGMTDVQGTRRGNDQDRPAHIRHGETDGSG